MVCLVIAQCIDFVLVFVDFVNVVDVVGAVNHVGWCFGGCFILNVRACGFLCCVNLLCCCVVLVLDVCASVF